MAGKTILCVDDEEFNLDILEERLTKAGYQVDLARNGTEALEALKQQPAKYAAVLLDRMMPDMDGVEVLHQAKKLPQLDGLPIIMQTAKASREDVLEGLEAGAHYYLTKPYGKKELLAILKSAVADFKRLRGSQAAIRDADAAMTLLQSARFTFRTLEEAHALAPLIASASGDQERVVVGLLELMLNAVEHGNLAITYKEKSALLEQDRWKEEIAARLASPDYKNREAVITVTATYDVFDVEIEDQGDGFDWQKYMQFDAARAFDAHGRGVMLANEMSFDRLEYMGKGNRVKATLFRKAGGE